MLWQPETKVLIKMVKSLNEELDMLQEMTSQAWFTLNKVCRFCSCESIAKERDETVERMNSLEKLVIGKYFINAYYLCNLELKREIEQYWGG